MTWTRPTLLALSVLFMLFVVIQFFLGGLIVFSNFADGIDEHETVGYPVLHMIPILMLIVAAIGRMGKKIIGMTVGLLVLIFIQPIWASIDTESDWINAIHVPFAMLIAFLGYHILVTASRAYRGSAKSF